MDEFVDVKNVQNLYLWIFLLRTNVQNVYSTYIRWNIWSGIFVTPLR